MKKKNQEVEQSKYHRSFAITLAILTSGFAFVSFLYYQASEYTVFFWLHQASSSILLFPVNVCVLIPITFICAFIELKPSVSRLVEVLIFGTLGLALCSTCSMMVLTVFKEYKSHDALYTQSYAYHVDSWWAVGVGGNSQVVYRLWWCDRLDLLCRRIFSHEEGMEFARNEYYETPATLAFNPNTNMIEFRLGDKLLYSWQE